MAIGLWGCLAARLKRHQGNSCPQTSCYSKNSPDPGLLLGTSAPVMAPNSKDYSSFSCIARWEGCACRLVPAPLYVPDPAKGRPLSCAHLQARSRLSTAYTACRHSCRSCGGQLQEQQQPGNSPGSAPCWGVLRPGWGSGGVWGWAGPGGRHCQWQSPLD